MTLHGVISLQGAQLRNSSHGSSSLALDRTHHDILSSLALDKAHHDIQTMGRELEMVETALGDENIYSTKEGSRHLAIELPSTVGSNPIWQLW